MKKLALIFVIASAPPITAHAQSDGDLARLRLLGVAATALGPISLPMPASRNHNYFIARLQSGFREGPSGDQMPAFAGGLDFQYRGGSTIGITGGYQRRDCGTVGAGCGGHAMFGIKSQINLVTGGSLFAGLLKDIAKRPYITVGFAALVILIPLAITSTNKMMRRLGRRWQTLHRWVYVAAILGVVHYYWQVKRDVREPLIYAGILAILLGYRLVRRLRKPKPATRPATSPSGSATAPERT